MYHSTPIKYNILNYHPLAHTNSTILSKHNNTILTLPKSHHNTNYNITTESLYPHQSKFHLPTIISPIHKNLQKDKIKKLRTKKITSPSTKYTTLLVTILRWNTKKKHNIISPIYHLVVPYDIHYQILSQSSHILLNKHVFHPQ